MSGTTLHPEPSVSGRTSIDIPVVLYSEMVADKSMHALIEQFLWDLPDRLRAIHAAWREDDMQRMTHLARLLQGASEGFGYPHIALAAGRLAEMGLCGAPPTAIRTCLHQLLRIYQAALRGLECGNMSHTLARPQ